MDDTLTVGGTTTISAAETETPEQSTGTGEAAPETQSTDSGGEQSQAEGSQQQTGGRRKWSMQDEVKELRSQRRELRERLADFDGMRNELAELREELNRRNQPNAVKTPANFWQDPEAILDAKMERLREELAGTFQRTREEEWQREQQRQETASATEFIRTQQGYDASDDEDLIEIIKENDLASLGPTRAAKIAWTLLQQQRGIGDRSIAKQRASGVQGQPPGAGFGRKTWSRDEFDRALETIEKNPHDPKLSQLWDELQAAHKEGRVK